MNDDGTDADDEDDEVDVDGAGAGAEGVVAEKKDSEWLPSALPLC